MDEQQYAALKLDNQLCFPLYASARAVTKMYKPFLDLIDLTYTQYIAMLILWEQRSATVKEMGERLYLDSGTLTPLLKKLEAKGLLTRQRSARDERNLIVTVTDAGMALREKALGIPELMHRRCPLSNEEAYQLYGLLQRILSMSAPTEE